MDLEEIYNQKHKKGIDSIINGNEFLDENLNNNDDTRKGIHLLIRPSEKVIKSIQNKARELQHIDSNLYIYSPECMHFTLFSYINQTENFKYKKEQKELYQRLSKEIISNFKKFTISCKGLMLTDRTILVKGYPERTMNDIRKKIRETLYKNDISYTELYKDDICHLSLVRFKNKIANREKLVKFVTDNYDYNFGLFDVSEVELICHDWYDTKRDIFDRIKLLT